MQRQIPSIKRHLDQGATVQQTYIFPPNQPLFNYYLTPTNRFDSDTGPVKQLDGATIQQGTPVIRTEVRVIARPGVPRPTTLFPFGTIGVTVQQTYIFPLAQPNFAYYRRNTFSQASSDGFPAASTTTYHQYYTGFAHTTKSLLRRGIGF